MRQTLALFLIGLLCLPPASLDAQSPAAPQKRKVAIQTPFGPIEVDEDDPRAAGLARPAPAAPAAAQTPAPQTPPAQAADEQANIALHLDNADIYQIIRIIGDALQLNYVIDPTVKGTVNINTSTNLKRSDLLPILETVLKINGATMIRNGNFYQVVPANTAVRQPLEVIDGRSPATSSDDQIVMQILRMKYVLASEMGKLLSPYLTEGGNIVVQDAGNVLLVSERRSNLRKLLDIVDIFDTNVFEGERVRLFQMKEALARDVVDDLQRVF